jgi:hypothetical protein
VRPIIIPVRFIERMSNPCIKKPAINSEKQIAYRFKRPIAGRTQQSANTISAFAQPIGQLLLSDATLAQSLVNKRKKFQLGALLHVNQRAGRNLNVPLWARQAYNIA